MFENDFTTPSYLSQIEDPIEIWVTFKCYHNKRIVVFDKYNISNLGNIRNLLGDNVPKIRVNRDGYEVVCIYNNNKPTNNIQISRAVLTSFIGVSINIDDTADHIDKNRTNNKLYNMRWLSSRGQQLNKGKFSQTNQKISVVCITTDTIYASAEEASFHTKEDARAIANCCNPNHRRKTTNNGYVWKYKEPRDDYTDEVWVKVGKYQYISNYGYVKTTNKSTAIIKSPKDYVPDEYPDTYPYIVIDGKTHYIHIMVAKYFVRNDNPEYTHVVNHIDGDKVNANSVNLEWITQSDNILKAYDMGSFDGYTTSRQKILGTNILSGEICEFKSITDAGRFIANKQNKDFTLSFRKAISKVLNIEGRTVYSYEWRSLND